MATTSSASSLIPSSSQTAPTTPGNEKSDFETFRDTEEAQKFVNWVKEQFTQAKNARGAKERQWFQNLSFFYGKQWIEFTSGKLADGYRNKIATQKSPYYADRKTINRIRSFVRTEISKFVSQEPTALSVPASAEEGDIRAAYAAEQVFQALSTDQHLRREFTKSVWWMVNTGNGFLKTWWDKQAADKANPGQQGSVKFGNVMPFNLFVPDLREQEIEDQPFVINAYTWTIEKCYRYFGEALKGVVLAGDEQSGNDIIEDGKLNLQGTSSKLKNIVVYELWAKPGATPVLPDGGYAVVCGNHLVALSRQGIPYAHGEYPFTKIEHIPTSTFYADSPVVDLIELQKEYNTFRTEIHTNGKRMARPQLLAQKGSIIAEKVTNEPGQIILYRPGFAPPTPLQLPGLPDWYMQQADRILMDFEDISGQHEVSKGQAPAGVTAGTAINYLMERDDQFLTEQYRSVEDAYAKIASQSLQLFVQYVDADRKIKTVGSDGAFDTLVLNGADIKNGLDVRIEPGSAIAQSKAARDARLLELFSLGAISDPNQLFKLMEIGGSQKILDTLNVAEKKAQRENLRFKMLNATQLESEENAQVQQMQASVQQAVEMGQMDAAALQEDLTAFLPPAIPVDEFDVHEVHIDAHNKWAMSQEYEALPAIIKAHHRRHVHQHEQALEQRQFEQAQQQMMMSGQNPAEPFAAEEAEMAAEPGMEEGGAPADPMLEGGAPGMPGDTMAPPTDPNMEAL